ncbi:MAG: hypothetical protein ACM31E_04130 [Fibrobacterota bacterium]
MAAPRSKQRSDSNARFGPGVAPSRPFAQGEGWHIERQGYLPQEYFGYSLALWAFLRNEHKPDWLKYLSVDINEYCKKSLQLLQYEHKNNGIMPWKNNDTLTDEKSG